MLRAISSMSGVREDDLLFALLRNALYPTIFVAELLRRAWMRVIADESGVVVAPRSIFIETKEQAGLTASYLLMARASLQPFGRRPRTERLS